MDRYADKDPQSFAVHTVIFLAGFTFLLYEVCWNRLLSLVLGTTVTASTIVLSMFMAGFGFGAWFWGRKANRAKNIGRLLTILLGGIGLFGIVNFFIIADTFPYLYKTLAESGFSVFQSECIIIPCSAFILFLQACLIGGVFPVVGKIAIGAQSSIAETLGRLYAIDTFGGFIGGLISGFLLLGNLGQGGTVLFAVAINLVLAGWVVSYKKFTISPIDSPVKDKSTLNDVKAVPLKDKVSLRRTALIGAFICGFSILSLQVLWLRMFKIYFTNTSYTFALIASIAIMGLFLGSWLFKQRHQKITDFKQAMIRVVSLLGGFVIVGLMMVIYLPHILMFPFQSMLGDPIFRVIAVPVIASLLIVLPPSVCSGYAFPLACRMYSAGRKSISGDIGLVLMVNTIGSVIGPVIAAFILIPSIGVLLSVVFILILLSVTLIVVVSRDKSIPLPKIMKTALYASALILMALVAMRPEIRILPPSFARFDREILFYKESVEGTLTVGKDKGTRSQALYTFVNNSAVIGSSYDAIKVVKMVGHFPFFLGNDCEEVLVIGFGIGVTTSAIASHPEVKSIESVELVEGLKDAAVYYKDLNQNVVNDARLKIIPGDGRHYLQATPKKYDLISCDPTHPILGSGNLYTQEYFQMCRDHLKPGGMVSQYLPLHKLGTEEFLGIINTFHSVFPNCTVWLGHYHAVLLGATEPLQIDFAEWKLNIEKIGQAPNFYVDPHHLAATLVLDGKTVEKLSVDSKINSDDLSYTEFFASSCLKAENLPGNVRFLMENRTPLTDVFTNIGNDSLMNKFVRGNQLMTQSLYYKLSGDNVRSRNALQQAIQVNPENEEYPFLMRLNF